MLFSTLTAIAGASAVLDRGFITYSNQAKMDMVDVDATCLKTHGAVSAETALQMAQGGLAKSRAELSISITGIAGAWRRKRRKTGGAGLYWASDERQIAAKLGL